MNELQSNKVAKRWKLVSLFLVLLLIALVVGGFLFIRDRDAAHTEKTDSLTKENKKLQQKLTEQTSENTTEQEKPATNPQPQTKYTSTQGDSLTITAPEKNATVTSPATVSGIVPSNWFNEGQFSAKLLNANNMVIASTLIKPTGQIDTTKPVAFSGSFSWNTDVSGNGFIVLEKANPSGLPANADSVKIPVVF